MAILNEMWVENRTGQKPAIRLDWSNDRHQRIEIEGRSPLEVISSIEKLAYELRKELHHNEI